MKNLIAFFLAIFASAELYTQNCRAADIGQNVNKVIQISVGNYHACALEAEGVKCWGYNGVAQITVPALNKPTQVSAGENYSCALDADGVKC